MIAAWDNSESDTEPEEEKDLCLMVNDSEKVKSKGNGKIQNSCISYVSKYDKLNKKYNDLKDLAKGMSLELQKVMEENGF